jgi:hypothetical protein
VVLRQGHGAGRPLGQRLAQDVQEQFYQRRAACMGGVQCSTTLA